MNARTAIKATPHMYRGYHFEDVPIQREFHDPAQWKEQRSESEYVDEIPLQSICGWQAKRFFGDIEDRKII